MKKRTHIARWVLGLTAVVCPAHAELGCLSQPVSAIDSTVFHRGELARLQKALGLSVGSRIDQRRLDDGIRAVFGQGRLQTIFIEATCQGGALHLNVRGAKVRKLRHVVFTGVSSELAEDVKRKSGLEEGKSTDLRAVEMVKESLRTGFQQKGYFFADVDVTVTDVPESNEADIEVRVSPGLATKVSGVTVTGGTPDENKRMSEQVTIRPGDVFQRSALDDSSERINEFLRSNRYSTSKVEEAATHFSDDKHEVQIQILVKLGERFQYLFTGNHVFEDYELRQLFTDELLSRSDATSRIVDQVEAKYRAAGFHFVKVRPDVQVDAVQHLNVVTFQITEGPRVRIRDVTFSDPGELGSGQLESLFFDGAPGALGRYLYWEAGFKEAVANLTKRLQSMGFLSSRIAEPKPLFSEDHSFADLFLDVDLGTRTYIGGVEFNGAGYFDKEKLQSLLSFRVGQPLNRQWVVDSRKQILDAYASEGFIDARFGETENDGIFLSRDAKVATIRLPVIEGTQYRVGEVKIDGIHKTKPVVLLREMRLTTGDKYDPVKVRRSEEEMNATGLFSRVEIVPNTDPAHPDHKDLKIVVRELSPGVGEVGLGVRYEDPLLRLRSFAGLAYRNLLGLNQTVSARSEISLPIGSPGQTTDNLPFIPFVEYAASLNYRAPYPLDLPVTYVGQVGLDRFETSINPLAILTRARVENRIEKRFTSWLTGIYRLHRFERNYTHYEATDNAPALPEVFESIGSTGPGVVMDFRDDPFNPTKGTFHSLDIEFAHPYLLSQDNIKFVMALSRNSIYIPLMSPFSLSAFIGVGYATALDGFSYVPDARLLSDLALGGQNSIRGIGFHAITANVTNTHWVGLYNGRAELAAALYNNFSLVGFFDTGRLYADTQPTVQDGSGVGVGVRYKTPVGPAVIDVAQGIGDMKQPSVQFYFTIGTL